MIFQKEKHSCTSKEKFNIVSLFYVCFFSAKLKRTLLCALVNLLSKAKSGLPDEFSQKMFPITPPGNGNVGLGPRELSEFGFKVGENSPPPKKSPAKLRQKIKTTFWGHEFFLLFKLKLHNFIQESAAKFTIFYLL